MTTRTDPIRIARVMGGADSLKQVQAYMPGNYQAHEFVFGDEPDDESAIIIAGVDFAGWTLDDYVIPRLASGLIFAAELESP